MERIYINNIFTYLWLTLATTICMYQYAKVVLFSSNYFFCFTLFAFDSLQFIIVVSVLQSVFFLFFINLNGEGASLLDWTHSRQFAHIVIVIFKTKTYKGGGVLAHYIKNTPFAQQ